VGERLLEEIQAVLVVRETVFAGAGTVRERVRA